MINHLAIVMDWNRRWAKYKFLPTIAWHKAWADNAKKITRLCNKKGIKYLTLWALSTENLKKRWDEEVEGIIKLVNKIETYLSEMIEEGLRFQVIWDIKKLPKKSQNILGALIKKTENNTWIIMSLALIYWWQDEIIRSIKKFIAKNKDKPNFDEIVNNLDKFNFREYLDTYDLPNPEVIVRTGWDIRHSGFLLFDSEYSEYYFTEKAWPSFDEEELDKVIDSYEKSKRNFGK